MNRCRKNDSILQLYNEYFKKHFVDLSGKKEMNEIPVQNALPSLTPIIPT